MRDLGGDVSTQQAAVIDLAVRTRLLLDSIDTWLLRQQSLVNARKRALLPVRGWERQALVDALTRYNIASYLAARAPQPGSERERGPSPPSDLNICYKQARGAHPGADHVACRHGDAGASRRLSRFRDGSTENGLDHLRL